MLVLTEWQFSEYIPHITHVAVNTQRQMVWFAFVLFNDTWYQEGHSVSCITILFSKLQITRSEIRPRREWAVSLLIAYMVTSIFLSGLCGYIWVNILTLSPPRSQI